MVSCRSRAPGLVVMLCLSLFSSAPLYAEDRDGALAGCALYRSKKEEVPVFSRAETTSEVRARLTLGEKVCYVGEKAGFAIVDWSKQRTLNPDRGGEAESEGPQLLYVRLVDLWEPREAPPKGGMIDQMLSRLQDYYNYWKHGGVPDDPYGPFRPLTAPFEREPECVAGKLCEKLESPDPTASGTPTPTPVQ